MITVPMFAETAYRHLVFDDTPNLNGFIVMPAIAAGETSTLTIRGHNVNSPDECELTVECLGVGPRCKQAAPE